jgi:hypothetical protein
MTSRVPELIDLIAQGKNAEALEVLNDDLLSRSYAKVEELKPQVAMDYFSPVINFDPETGEMEATESEVEETEEVEDTEEE